MMRNGPQLLMLTLAGISSWQAAVATDEAVVDFGVFCPSEQDLGFDFKTSNASKIYDQGWLISGAARVHTKAAYNLLGGSVEFDLDLILAKQGVNSGIYTISPALNGSAYTKKDYCSTNPEEVPACMEVDIIQTNGKCGGETALHTHRGYGGNCDTAGCRADYHFDKIPHWATPHVRTEFDLSGVMTTYIGGRVVGYKQLYPMPTSDTTSSVAATMRSVGVVLLSEQFSSWVPLQQRDQCGPANGNIDQSTFSVRNLVIHGGLVSGPKPHSCRANKEGSLTAITV